MPRKLETIPDDLKHLISTAEAVVIGNQCYELFPLTASQVATLSSELADLVGAVFAEVLESIKDKDLLSMDPEEMTKAGGRKILLAAQRAFQKLAEDERVITMIAEAVDVDKLVVTGEMTLKQVHHFLGVFWQQNFDLSGSPDSHSKNFKRLLGAFGIGNRDSRVFQWADVTLKLLLDTQSGSDAERIDTVLQIAYELELIDETPEKLRENLIHANESTPTSLTTSDSTGSTLTENDSSNVTSPESDVVEDSETSASEPGATVTSSPDGK